MVDDTTTHSLASVAQGLIGKSVTRPTGTLAGHAAGLPFEDLVHLQLASAFPGRAYRHFELLNEVYAAHPDAVSSSQRLDVLGPDVLQHLLARGGDARAHWSPTNLFVAKQNDTAESIILPTTAVSLTDVRNHPVHLVDVKTQAVSKKAQPPNIISAQKLVKACSFVLKERPTTVPFEISYVGVQWEDRNGRLVCTDATAVSLFRIPPDRIYINWAAAMQIQFHPFGVSQDFTGTPAEWAYAFVDRYCTERDRSIVKQQAEVADLRELLTSP